MASRTASMRSPLAGWTKRDATQKVSVKYPGGRAARQGADGHGQRRVVDEARVGLDVAAGEHL